MRPSFFILSFFFLSLVSCSERSRYINEPNVVEIDNTSGYYSRNYEVFKLDSCEYIVVGNGNSKWGSHKGDCNNPIHGK